MKKRDFSSWLSTFTNSINEYSYYTDFKKVYSQDNKFKIEFNILNSLVGSNHIEGDFVKLLSEYPKCIQAIPILLAVRNHEIYCQDDNGGIVYKFDCIQNTLQQYCYFMHQTGLFDLIQNHIISNLYDYVTGIEVGLGTNGRKNRGGHQMEDLVERYIKHTEIEYYKEMDIVEIEKKWNVDLSTISADGTSSKRWDFVVHTDDCIYLIETNFYTGGGSKLNETARSYKMIAEETRSIRGVQFVWITDGFGWKRTKRNLKETFDVLDNIYNIADLENGALDQLFHIS